MDLVKNNSTNWYSINGGLCAIRHFTRNLKSVLYRKLKVHNIIFIFFPTINLLTNTLSGFVFENNEF